jgi:hypothetical protein
LGDCGYDIPVSTSEMKKAILYYLNWLFDDLGNFEKSLIDIRP